MHVCTYTHTLYNADGTHMVQTHCVHKHTYTHTDLADSCCCNVAVCSYPLTLGFGSFSDLRGHLLERLALARLAPPTGGPAPRLICRVGRGLEAVNGTLGQPDYSVGLGPRLQVK